MLVWYVATAVAGVWLVFDSPSLDYRLVAVGSVLPVAEIVLGRPGPLHSLVVAVAVLAAVMIGTMGRGRRLVRRRLLGLPIGLFAHLVFSGTFSDVDAFWWPLTGLDLSTAEPPELARGPLTVVLELLGIALAVWWVRTTGLDDAEARQQFVATGRVPRRVPPVQGSC